MTRPDCVVVMAKAPMPGAVKTRLQPLLGPDGCAQLQTALITVATRLGLDSGYRVYLAVTPESAVSTMRGTVPQSVRVISQRGHNLGQRMTAAVRDAFADGASRVVVTGTDAPTLDGSRLAAAFAALDNHGLVLGPAVDGGYYLIGMSRPRDAVFALPPGRWGGPQVLNHTLRLAAAASAEVHLLPVERDLDTADDAAALVEDTRLPTDVRRLLTAALVPA